MTSIFNKDKIVTVTPNSTDYPTAWKKFSGAPEALYCVGDTSLLNTRILAMVGSRKTPAVTVKLGENTAEALSRAFTLATGVAAGGDSAVIEGALKGSGKVICVLAGGFSALPQTNLALLERVAKKGLVLSPYSYETPVRVFSYEYRNKLLARLSEGALILSAGEKSGALITAGYAQKQGKPLFAFPYAPNSAQGAGCNALIKKGAKLVENAEDVLEFFGLKAEENKPTQSLSETEEKLLSILRELGEGHVSELSEKSGVPLFKIKAVLSALEIKGLVCTIGGNRYASV